MNRKRIFIIIAILILLSMQFSTVMNFTMSVQAAPAALSAMSCTPLTPLATSANTGEKPQSKVWTHDGEWWSVLPATTPTASSNGTWLWKLVGSTWTEVLKLSSETGTRADVKSVGNVAHILLYDGSPELVSVEYVAGSYQLWSDRSTPSPIDLPHSEIATIDIDSTGRMWLASDAQYSVVVYYSDSPYETWNGPITLTDENIDTDDISVVTALPNDTIGVLWSNQEAYAFGFKTHVDGADPSSWSADEVPASGGTENKIADDHVNVAVASDGTLYAAVKTGLYGRNAYMLVRRPGTSAAWDEIYVVNEKFGTRPIVVLNETTGVVDVIFTILWNDTGIVYEETPVSDIDFSGGSTSLISGIVGINNASSTKQNYTEELVVISSDESNVYGVFCTSNDADIWVWNGSVDNNWQIADNWSPNSVPDSQKNVLLPEGSNVQLSTASECNSITIENGATLDLSTYAFTVEDSLTNNGTLKQTMTIDGACTEGSPCQMLLIKNIAGDSIKYYGVDFVSSSNMGSTTLEIRGNQACGTAGNLSDTVLRCYEIDPTTSQAATLTFYYRYEEENGNPTPQVYHYTSGSEWEIESYMARGGSGDGMFVKVSGVDDYSPFTLKDSDGPTAITLSGFSARSGIEAGKYITWLLGVSLVVFVMLSLAVFSKRRIVS